MSLRQSVRRAEVINECDDLAEAIEGSESKEASPQIPRLTPEHWQEIIVLTSLEDDMDHATALITQVEEVLGIYPLLLAAIADSPVATRKLVYLEPLAQRAERLLAALRAREGDHLWFDFALQGMDYATNREALAAALENFLCGTQQVLPELEHRNYRQGPTEQVQYVLIGDLCRLFDGYGRTAALSGTEVADRNKTRFVRLCLDAAQIQAEAATVAGAQTLAMRTSVSQLARPLMSRNGKNPGGR